MSKDIIISNNEELISINYRDKVSGLRNKNIKYYTNKIFHKWECQDGVSYIVIGDIIGHRLPDESISPPQLLKVDPSPFENVNQLNKIEGYFIVLKFNSDGTINLYRDKYGRIDLYIYIDGKDYIIASSLKLISVDKNKLNASSLGLTHSLVVYGARPAKKQTYFQEISRLGVNEFISFLPSELIINEKSFEPLPQRNYTNKDLNKYYELFLESLRSRSINEGNVVYLSSGWDSTSILAGLIHLIGNKKVRAVIGRMQYSSRSGVINQFEIDRAKAIADYYDVKLDICEFDYRNNVEDLIEEIKPLFQSHQFANLTGINHWNLAKYTASTGQSNQTVFAGEMSDGAHNLGFSQYATIFHPSSYDFREYSDKMASFLFSPTFINEVINGRIETDPVWQLFKGRSSNILLENVANSESEIILQFLESLFLRGGRLPFYSIENSDILSQEGKIHYSTKMKENYLNIFKDKLSTEKFYSIVLHLYNSFHWQGSTVATLEHTAAAHGLRCVLPFHDNSIIDFLSSMPESWGRGLDLNPTKYPLKWTLQNKIDYPYHLQKGPHSYLYDIDPNFNHSAEIVYGSGFTSIFKKKLVNEEFREKISNEYLNFEYINGLIKGYLSGEVYTGTKLSELLNLSMISTLKIY